MLRFEFSTLWILTLTALPVGAAQAPCETTAAQLEHSAPWVGGALELALDGAAPGASVRLFHSPSEVHSQTPYGLLELDREGLGLAAGGQADANGHWAVSLAIPLDASLVEVGGHYQALVQGPVGPATLSAAVHLSYLGPRSYTLCAGQVQHLDEHPTLDVHALADGSRVASIALGAWPQTNCPDQGRWRPVFSANLARGAFLSGCGELVVIDNFHCTVVAVLAVESAYQRLLRSADGRLAYVLEEPASGAAVRIRALDLETATFVATLELPDTCSPFWALDETTQVAFVQDVDPLSGQFLARRVDLAGWQVLDALPLGTARDVAAGGLEVVNGWLFAAAKKTGSLWHNSLCALDLHGSGGSVSVPFGSYVAHSPVAVPSVQRLFLGAGSGIGPAHEEVFVAPLDEPQQLAWVPSTPNEPFTFGPSVVRDERLWVLAKSYDSDHAARLWNLDALALTWSATSDFWVAPWPVTLLAARGPLVDVLLMPRSGSRTAWATFEPALLALDPDTGAVTDSWLLEWGAVAGYVLEPE
jgi:hypothetical protein